MTTQNQEVNQSSDAEDLDGVLTVADLDNPDSQDVGDAIVSDPENQPIDEEKETPSESSTELQPADESDDESDDEGDESDDSALPNPKPVAGETARERALREEITRVKRKLRAERGQKMFGGVSAPINEDVLTDEDREFLAEVDPEQAANVEKLIAISAKKMGFVKKDEFVKQNYQDTAQSVLDDFLEKHPEYDEKNDPDGVLWGQFQKEYSQYKTPENPKDLNRIFSKIHKEVFGVITDDSGLKQVEAKKEKLKVASHSASSGGSSSVTDSSLDEETKKLVDSGALKGFDDETLKELGLK